MFKKLKVCLPILSLGGFESRPFIRGLQGRSLSMRAPSKPKDTLSKVLPMRWSLGSKDRRKHDPVPPAVKEPGPAELVQYLESGRRPRCTKDSIVTLMSEPRGSNDIPEGQAAAGVQSSGNTSLSCEVKSRVESPQVPEGQRRPSEKTTSSKGSRASHTKDESSMNMSSSSSSSTLTRRKEGRKQSLPVVHDKAASRSTSAGAQPSSSTPSLGDGTLRRQKGERTEREHHSSHEGSKTRKGEVPKSHEGLFSFFKGKIKKEKESKMAREGEPGRDFGEEETSRTLSRLSLSNGAAMRGADAKEGRSSGWEQRPRDEMANGKVAQRAAVIKRSQSSSNIPSKTEHSMHRTASLHRNGMSAGPARSLTADKPSYGTLQRTRYSTTSLGRKRNVLESSFWLHKRKQAR